MLLPNTQSDELRTILEEIKTVFESARNKAAYEVNKELLNAYWHIGKIICEHEQAAPNRANYGVQTLKTLSKELTKQFGKGFSRSNLQNMRALFLAYPKCQTLSGKLDMQDKTPSCSAN